MATRIKFLPAKPAGIKYVYGESVNIDGWMFTIHRPVGESDGWAISDPGTGLRVTIKNPTKPEAIAAARRDIEYQGGILAVAFLTANPQHLNPGRNCITGVRLLPYNHLIHNGFRYSAGGPLDAPDWIACGSHIASRYYRDGQSSTICRR